MVECLTTAEILVKLTKSYGDQACVSTTPSSVRSGGRGQDSLNYDKFARPKAQLKTTLAIPVELMCWWSLFARWGTRELFIAASSFSRASGRAHFVLE